MNWIPFETYVICSSKSIAKIRKDFEENCAKHSLLRFFTKKPLIGQRKDRKFWLHRSIKYYSNAFIPFAFVTIESKQKGVEVKVQLRMNMFVIVFMAIWLGVVSIANIFILIHGGFNFALFIMFMSGYLLMQFGFWLEVPKLKKLINDIFNESD